MSAEGASQVALVVKNPPAIAGDIRDTGSIPGLGRSAGGGHDNPLQYSCLENSMDRGAWRATVHGVTKSLIRLKRLSAHTHTHTHTSQNRACTRDMWQGARCGMIFMLAFIIYKHKYILYMICDRLDVVGELKRAWSLDAVPLSPPSPAKTLQSFAFLSPCELSSPFEVPNHYPGNLFCF